MVAVVQRQDWIELEGRDTTQPTGFINATTEWLASSVDKVFFVAPRSMKVRRIVARVTVAGTDTTTPAPSAVIRKVPTGTAIGSGTALHSTSIDLKGSADTNQVITLSTTSSTLDLAQGDCLAIDFTGTLTGATGAVTVGMAPK